MHMPRLSARRARSVATAKASATSGKPARPIADDGRGRHERKRAGEGGRTRPRPRPTLQRLSVGHSVGAAAQWLAAGGLLGVGRVEMAINGSAADSVIRFHRCSLLMLIFFLRKFSVDFVRRRPCPNSRPQPRGE